MIGNGGATDTVTGGVDGDVNGGASVSAVVVLFSDDTNLSPSLNISLVDSSSFPDQIDTTSLLDVEKNFIHSLFSSPNPFAFKAFPLPFRRFLTCPSHPHPIQRQ